MLSSRLIKLRDTMATSSKLAVKLLVNLAQNDMRTVMGRNLGSLQGELGVDELTPTYDKEHLRYFDAPPQHRWMAPCLKELLDVKTGNGTLEGFSNEDVNKLINFLCSS